jgi:Protein of unknown function (DUF2652)
VRALLVLADIAGYTRFMKLHRMSLAHAQENTDRLLKAVVDAAPRLRLADLEGDAAFLYVSEPEDEEVASTIAGLAAAMHRAFHGEQERMGSLRMCACDACCQVGDLRVKFIAHLGDVVRQKIGRTEKLAGLDVILAHRLLKNTVPLPEYLLLTRPVLDRCDDEVRKRAEAIEEELEGIGTEEVYYVDVSGFDAPPPPAAGLAHKIRHELALTLRSVPYYARLKRSRYEAAR